VSRRDDMFVPQIVLDRTSEIPLHTQIRHQIAEAIRDGAVRNGVRLPSTRLLAKLLRVSRNTVFTAYEELAADDLIRGERGAGMRVHDGSTAPEVSWVAVKRVIETANYPAKVVAFEDPDGNPLYVRF
jgi:GntR family transcriptional regulator/MocR family aminotransferase